LYLRSKKLGICYSGENTEEEEAEDNDYGIDIVDVW
jgi:hypothetical protein